MGVKDIIQKSLLEGYATSNITVVTVLVCMLCTLAISLYIYYVYKYVNRNAFYNKSFHLSLILMAIVTAAIILTIQSNIVVSLGMVGALSIIRFRTAIKDPIDLGCLFWAISAGIICGAGFALLWLERSGLQACRCDPLNCFALRSGEAGHPLIGTVRLYEAEGITRGVLYLKEVLQPFLWDSRQVTFLPPEENLLGVPALVPFANNCEGCGDFEAVTGLVDAYNLLLSGAMDDMQSVANAFLAIYGLQGTTQSDIDEANRSRVLSLHEGGKAEFVVKNLNHEALAQLEANLRRSILQLSMTPDLSDEAFAGTASGVALQYKLWGIEQIRAAKERTFSEGLLRLLATMSAGLQVLGTPVDLTDCRMTFYKNLPRNHAELAETLLALSPVLSQRTILENLPFVEDAEEELRRKAAETN